MEENNLIKNILESHPNQQKPTIKSLISNHVVVYSDDFLKPYFQNLVKKFKLNTQQPEELPSTYQNIITQISKSYKSINVNHQNRITLAKKIASLCSREIKRGLQKPSRTNIILKGKKYFRELQNSGKKDTRDSKKRISREETDKRRKELERIEVERQARKLDFLINQTELYSHFVLNKKKNFVSEKVEEDEDDEYSMEKAKLKALEAAKKQEAHTNNFSTTEIENITEQPKVLKAQLKEYQFKGLKWLANLYNQGINGILADDMGLGKTIQSISLLAYLYESKQLKGPFLIVSPTSTLPNWASELERFVPELTVAKYWGTDRKKMKFGKFNIVLTSYSILLIDEKAFCKTKWQYMILDEAQAIKSSKSQRWSKLLKIPSRNRLLLTGTPIQNNLKELWSLLHFIMPTLFDSLLEFEDWFMKMNNDKLDRLHVILKPFMLRREKKDVATELKEKLIKVIYCDLSYRQRVMYNTLEKKLPVNFCDTEVANVLMHYRKVCNHPNLFHKPEVETGYFMKDEDKKSEIKIKIPEEVFRQKTKKNKMYRNIKAEDFKIYNSMNSNDEEIFLEEFKEKILKKVKLNYSNIETNFYKKVINENLDIKTEHLNPLIKKVEKNEIKFKLPEVSSFILESGKLSTLDILLRKLKEKGHRILIYFQMTKMMNLMEDYLKIKKYSYLRLDGSNKLHERKDLVSRWQNEDIFIFLLSTRAGGLGINLTAADTVIFYDSDWNPTVDKQAMDRAHRLGQLRDVTVYKLVCRDTVEERVMEMAGKKDEIQKMVIEKGNFEGSDI